MSETKLEVKTMGHSENFREDSESFRSDCENFAGIAKIS